MKIEKNKVVELIYELEVDGQIVDRTVAERPLDYIQGTHSLLEKFEANVEGLEPGGKFAFTLTPQEGYGEVDPERIVELPKSIFMGQDGKPMEQFMQVGAMVPLVNGSGQMVPGKVLAVAEDTVTVDLNSPMAGKTLNFIGEILSVRDATAKELEEGLHGEYVHSNCGGGCGHCGGHHGEGHCGGHHGNGGCCGGHEDGECHHGEGGCGHCHHDE